MRWLLRLTRHILTDDQALLIAAKGLESRTGLRMSQVVEAELGLRRQQRVAVLSGPNLAAEVAKGMPTSAVIACADSDLARQIQQVFMQPAFRVYTNPDLVGVELGGALKNVIAIGAGISDGLGFGDNTKAAYLTRGLAEMTRLGVALGANPATFQGLSGVGDLVVTCAGPSSRNHHVGKELAAGRSLKSILSEMRQIAEGVPSARAALRLAVRAGVEAPITEAICSVLFEGLDPRKAVANLMTRSGKDELQEPWLAYG
jgi:glycerol-3-phosphate dehydrogenase (NAD(P)+)